MIKKMEFEDTVVRTLAFLKEANIKITAIEEKNIEVADFGLSQLENIGLQILTYINTDRVCAKELVLFPFQTCPEHKHVGHNGLLGKEETFRVRKGEVYLYVEGDSAEFIKAKKPKTITSVYNEIILKEGEQYTIYPNIKHWFQAGSDGAIVSEFSTKSSDETDVFTDENVCRTTYIEE